MERLRSYPKLQLAVHVGAVLPVLWLAISYWQGALGVDPIQILERRTGDTALVLLLLSLACTPLTTLTGSRQLIKLSRPLGIYAFLYGTLHFLTFTGIDFQFNFPLLQPEFLQKKYIYLGITALLILSLLAVTSFKSWMKRLGKNWKRLHRLVYLAGVLVVIHYTWAKKGDLFHLQGEVLLPFLAALTLSFLLVMRLPGVRRSVNAARRRLSSRLSAFRVEKKQKSLAKRENQAL